MIGLNKLDEGDLDRIPILRQVVCLCRFIREENGRLKLLNDPDDPEREEYLYWLGGSYDPEAWESSAVNLSLHVVRVED